MAISRNLKINVTGKTAKFDKEVYLFQGDKNINFNIEIIDNEYKYTKTNGNMLLAIEGDVLATIKILKPNMEQLTVHNVEVIDSKLSFTVTEDLIDELEEIGVHKLQIFLHSNDSHKHIPPVDFEVVAPLFIDESNIELVEAIADEANIGECVVASEVRYAIRANGDYVATNWSTGDRITAAKLNKIESKVKELDTSIVNKADAIHTHSNYANTSHTHNVSEIEGLDNVEVDLSNYYTKTQTDNKISEEIEKAQIGGEVDLSPYATKEDLKTKAEIIHSHSYNDLKDKPTIPSIEGLATETFVTNKIAEAQLDGGEVDLSGYASKDYVDDEIAKIELKEGPQGEQGIQGPSGKDGQQGPKGDKGDTGEQGPIGPKGDKGDVGERGPQGLQGEQGPAGKDGIDGSIFDDTELKEKDADLEKKITVLNDKVDGLEQGGNIVIRDIEDGEIFEIDTTVPTVSVTSVSLNKSTTTVSKGSNETLVATVLPSNATNKNVTWSSSNTSVATVSNGVVSGVSNGNCVITVTTVDGNKTATCNVTVETATIPVTGVSLDRTTHVLKVDETVQLTATILPSNASNKSVAWSSSNTSIATVVNGLVTAKAEGECIISVTTVDGSKTSTCNVTVSAVQIEDGYVTENIDIMYDLTKYEDGYSGDVIDSVNNVKAIVTGQESYVTGRNGFVSGKFMIDTHKTAGSESTFAIPNRPSYAQYPQSIEIYGAIRDRYNPYSANGQLTFYNSITNANAYTISTTRDGDGAGNGIMVKCNQLDKIQINGTLSTPLVNYPYEFVIAKTDTPSLIDTHIVICLNQNAQKVYMNGVLVGESFNQSTSISGNTRNLMLFTDFLKCDLKLVRVYKSYMTDEQVQQNYNDVIQTIGGGAND